MARRLPTPTATNPIPKPGNSPSRVMVKGSDHVRVGGGGCLRGGAGTVDRRDRARAGVLDSVHPGFAVAPAGDRGCHRLAGAGRRAAGGRAAGRGRDRGNAHHGAVLEARAGRRRRGSRSAGVRPTRSSAHSSPSRSCPYYAKPPARSTADSWTPSPPSSTRPRPPCAPPAASSTSAKSECAEQQQRGRLIDRYGHTDLPIPGGTDGPAVAAIGKIGARRSYGGGAVDHEAAALRIGPVTVDLSGTSASGFLGYCRCLPRSAQLGSTVHDEPSGGEQREKEEYRRRSARSRMSAVLKPVSSSNQPPSHSSSTPGTGSRSRSSGDAP
jgi:hypothetical protein